MKSPKFKRLSEPVRIGKLVIKNRTAMAPMGVLGLVNPDGTMTQRAIDYYTERAKGGIGLIITSLFKVENEIERIVGALIFLLIFLLTFASILYIHQYNQLTFVGAKV